MAHITLKGTPVNTVGELPAHGDTAPDFTVTRADLVDVSLKDFATRRVILNIFPSVDTGVCAASVRRFNEIAADLDNTSVICVSADLPFALGRFCGAEGIENVTATSVFRSSFGDDYGIKMADGPMAGVLARSVVVLDETAHVTYTQLVPEIGTEPDYDSVLASLT